MADASDHPGGDERTREAIARLVDEHGGRLYTLGVRFCGDASDAEDLVQETFLQAFRGWGGFEGRSSEKTWLYTIAARACQRMRRKRAGEPARLASLDEELPFGERRIAMIADDAPDGVRAQIEREARERVEAAIASLPEPFRMAVVLKELAGFTSAEVAAILGIDEATVRTRVHRARLKLRAAADAAIPRAPGEAPPPAYEERVCLDLLDAKQGAIDRGVAFDTRVICERCRSVFASLDLTHRVCGELGGGSLPAGVRERLLARLGEPD